MQAFRFVHCADLHLDSPFRGMSHLPEKYRKQVRESTFGALQQLVSLAIRERADFVLISGDIYDLADRSLRAQIRFQRAVEELAAHRIQVLVIHGNHDPLDGRAARLTWPDRCHFFGSEQAETAVVECPERGVLAYVHGISYRTAAVTEPLIDAFRQLELAPNAYHIGMLHTNVDGQAGHDHYAPCSKRDLLDVRMNYWALGHVHTRNIIHGGTGGKEPCIVYPGNTQGRSVRECGPRGCYIVDVDEDGNSSLSFHALDRIRWFVKTVDVTGLETEQELKEALELQLETIRQEADGRSAIVRIVLEGRGRIHELLRSGSALEELTEELRDPQFCASLEPHDGEGAFLWVESIADRSGREVDMDKLLSQRSFVGDLLRMSRELQRNDVLLAQFREEAVLGQLIPSKIASVLLADSWEAEELRSLLTSAEQLLIDTLADGGWEE